MTKQYIGNDVYDIRFTQGNEVQLSEGDIEEIILDFEKRTILDNSMKRDLSNAIENNSEILKNITELESIMLDTDPVVKADAIQLMKEMIEHIKVDCRDQSFNLGEVDKLIQTF